MKTRTFGPVLADNGDREVVETGLERLRRNGNGAALQRRMFQQTNSLHAVVVDTVRRTLG